MEKAKPYTFTVTVHSGRQITPEQQLAIANSIRNAIVNYDHRYNGLFEQPDYSMLDVEVKPNG